MSSSSSENHFGDRLAASVGRRESQLVLGIDPDPGALWLSVSSDLGTARDSASRLKVALLDHCRQLIDATADCCVAVKLQLACFERLGPPGWEALFAVSRYAQEASLLVLADGKRGDISTTAAAYAQALLGPYTTQFGTVETLSADAFTANPLLGLDSLEPLVEAARGVGAGIFSLVRTSNPGARDLQDLELAKGGTVWQELARFVGDLGVRGVSGLTDIGAVTGATAPEHLEKMRELMPRAVFLLPGVGAQGGRVADLRAAFLPGRAAGLITASRSIANAYRETGGNPSVAAREAALRLREAAWNLS